MTQLQYLVCVNLFFVEDVASALKRNMVYSLVYISLYYTFLGLYCLWVFSASSTAKPYLCLDSPPHTSTTKGEESPNNANGIEEQAPEPLPQSNMVLRKRIRKIKQGMKRCVICFQLLFVRCLFLDIINSLWQGVGRQKAYTLFVSGRKTTSSAGHPPCTVKILYEKLWGSWARYIS
jgi:hypothetical protein